jgi:Mrp family chromosome partitioning ATPase
LKDQTGVSDVETQKSILLNRIAGLQKDIDSASAMFASTIRRIESLETQLANTPRQIAMSQTTNEAMGVVSQAKNDLNKLRAELDQKLVTYLPTSPAVLQLQEQISRAESRIQDLEKDNAASVMGLNPTWTLLDGQLANERTNQEGLDAQLKSLNAELARAREGQAVLNDVELKMGQLAREQGMVVEQLKKVVEGRDFSSIDQAMGKDRVGSVSASQMATLPQSPSSPNRKLLIIFGLFAALVGGGATAFVSEMLDHSVNKPQDLKRLGFGRVVSIPTLRMTAGKNEPGSESSVAISSESQAIVDLTEQDTESVAPLSERLRPTRYVRSTSKPRLTALPMPNDTKLSPRELLQQWKSQPVGSTAEPAARQHDPVVMNAATSRPQLSPRYMEACHALLERLVFAPVASGEFAMPRSIAVLGVTPGQGTTTLAAHLAAALAEYLPNVEQERESDRVLVVDGNLAAPAMHRVLDVTIEAGISDWIKQSTTETPLGDFVRQTGVPKLDLLSAGAASVGHQPGRWTEAVNVALDSEYEAVIVDLPSMARSESTARVAGMCDAALLVVECGGVNREVVRQAAMRLAESGVKLLGVVLNKRTYPIPDKLYRWI